MTAGCARCGTCCENIWCETAQDLPHWTTAAMEGVPDPGTDEGWTHWQSSGWEDRAKAQRWYDPDGDNRKNAEFIVAHWHPNDDGETYSCDRFDPATRLCTAHDGRPAVCSGFPWYGRDPDDEHIKALPAHCSYLADVPPDQRPEGSRPLIPLTPA